MSIAWGITIAIGFGIINTVFIFKMWKHLVMQSIISTGVALNSTSIAKHMQIHCQQIKELQDAHDEEKKE